MNNQQAFYFSRKFAEEQLANTTEESLPLVDTCIKILNAYKKAVIEGKAEDVANIALAGADDIEKIYGVFKYIDFCNSQL